MLYCFNNKLIHRLIRLLYYLPMERMLRKRKDNSDYEIDRELTWMFAIEKNAEYQEKIKKLEKENKKLKKECEENDYLVEDNARWMKKCEEKIMEIKKLNIKVASLEWEIKWLNYTIEKLREENQTLESDGYKM